MFRINQDVMVKVGEDWMPGQVRIVGKNKTSETVCRVEYVDDYGYLEVGNFAAHNITKIN